MNKTKNINFRLTPEDYQWLKKRSKKIKMSVGELMRAILTNYKALRKGI